MGNAKILYTAEFNPKIKSYLLWYGILICIMTVFLIPLIPLWILIAIYYLNVYFERLHCELTTRSLRFQKGYIFHTERTIPLDKIQDLTFKEGPLLKVFGLSILKIETAGNSAQAASDLTLIGIINASDFRNMVLDQRDKVTDNETKASTSALEMSDHSVTELLKEIRDSLVRIEKGGTN